MFCFSTDTPDWIKDWVTWTTEQLIPNYDVTIVMVDDIDPETPENKGEAETHSQYLRTFIRYEKDLEDNKDGHERVVHEVVHAFLDAMDEAAENLITSKRVRNSCWKLYCNAEETTVVLLSRLLVLLRGESGVEK